MFDKLRARVHHAPIDNANGDTDMTRLINAYRKCPSPSNRRKLQAYLDRHMMAVCLASEAELAFLKANEFKI